MGKKKPDPIQKRLEAAHNEIRAQVVVGAIDAETFQELSQETRRDIQTYERMKKTLHKIAKENSPMITSIKWKMSIRKRALLKRAGRTMSKRLRKGKTK